ncbi:hypothetical protein Vretifemale_9575 [Volvox reticuliferus]|uniref:Uncharacterized protein n=1 Tax=Volvox reticuliferus TaxID=1737510 RepID=A0A8J4CEU2_9CHLO|nr:hypothetical protein Vretifemale_9575 [Volvox reticuliferus]
MPHRAVPCHIALQCAAQQLHIHECPAHIAPQDPSLSRNTPHCAAPHNIAPLPRAAPWHAHHLTMYCTRPCSFMPRRAVQRLAVPYLPQCSAVPHTQPCPVPPRAAQHCPASPCTALPGPILPGPTSPMRSSSHFTRNVIMHCIHVRRSFVESFIKC